MWLYYNKKILKKKKKNWSLITQEINKIWYSVCLDCTEKEKKKKKIAFDVHGSHKYEKTQIYL